MKTRTRVLLWLWAGIVGAWMVLPTLVVIPLSFTGESSFNFPPDSWSLRWYRNFFESDEWMSSLTSTAQVAVVTTVLATVVGTLAALGLQRLGARFVVAMQGFYLIPMIVPGIVVAVGMYSLFLRLGLSGTLAGFVLAHSVLALPFVIINVSASLRGFDERLRLAAAGLGANQVVVFFRVVLPSILPGVIAGAIFAFMTSFDEVVISLFIQSPTLQTLPVHMYASVTQDSDPTVAAAAVLVIVLTIALVAIPQAVVSRTRRILDNRD
jgi:putative spermidine/putrescine transport system permease protein